MLARGILGSGRTRGVSFRPFLNSSVGGGLLVPYSLLGSPVIKQLMQMVTMVPGQGGRFQFMLPLTGPEFSLLLKKQAKATLLKSNCYYCFANA